MSLVDSQQDELNFFSTTSTVVDKSCDYNAETETNKNYQNSQSEDKTKSEYRISYKFNRNKGLYIFAIKMYNIFKELAFMFFLALAYAALKNDTPKVSKSPPAVPFFPQSSIVEDWYRGELSAALKKARQSDIAFIMFYAPWDAECQAVRSEFDLAARYMQKAVTFIAVNCWQPGSECRNQYHKAYKWPILIAYPSRGKGIQYRGIFTAPYMVKFLNSLSRPLMRIYEESEVHGLLALNDAVILGCVNALPGSSDYAVLYSTALTILESDPSFEVPFVVLTGFNNTCIETKNDHALKLHLWNETLLYPHNEQWKLESIITWIQKNLHQVSAWVIPSNTKSALLSQYLQPGPTLMLFTPKNPLEASQDYYNLLHEISLEYHDCGENNRVKLSLVLLPSLRIEIYLKHKELLEECSKQKTNKQQQIFPSVVTYTLPEKWVNDSSCQSDSQQLKDSCSKCDSSDVLKDRFPSHCKHDCSESYRYEHQGNFNIHQGCKTRDKKLKTTLNDKLNSKEPSNLEKLWREEKCHRAAFARKIYPSTYSKTIIDFVDEKKTENFAKCSGLVCKTNVSLTFIALDSLQHYHFAERLGIDLSTRIDRTAAVIINEKMETHHVMEEPVNDKTLRQFVINFTKANLPRAFNSGSDVKTTYTHIYSSEKACNSKDSSQFCITELDSKTFLPTVLKQDQVVLVFYYSKQCSFCSGISYMFLSVAKMFSPLSFIQFVRIDGESNTLPWEFMMDRYPTILFFPFRRKTETRVFPQNMEISVSNIVSFILANLNPTLKLHAMWTLCNQAKLEEDRQMCVVSTRAENLDLIDHTLRAWRKADVTTKSKLLYKLQQLRNINLLLALDPENSTDLERYMSQLHWSDDDPITTRSVKYQYRNIKDEL